MKFDVSSSALLTRLQSISKVIASKNTLPILDSFLFQLEGNKLTITASDVETRLVTTVDVMNANGSGLFAVSANRLCLRSTMIICRRLCVTKTGSMSLSASVVIHIPNKNR